MKRATRLLAILATFVATACGVSKESTDPPTLEALFPSDNELGSWAQVADATGTKIEIARTFNDVVGMINGSAEPYKDVGFKGFGRGRYGDGTRELLLWIWEMNDDSGAVTIFDKLTNKPAYLASSWTTFDAGNSGRYADTGVKWWLNSRQSTYYVEAWIGPNDEAGRDRGMAFLKGVLQKMP